MAVGLSGYEALTPLGGQEVRLRFTGPFEGREVQWDATFMTLRHYRQSAPQRAHAGHNLIAIGASGQSLTVVLDVAAFDAPTVLKTIIMVRQYKRLRRGEMTFATAARG